MVSGSWKDLTRVKLTKLVTHLRETRAPNTARTLTAIIKAFLNLYSEEVKVPCKDFAKVLHVSPVPSQHVILSTDEIKRLENYVPTSNIEYEVKNLAMRELYTGARGSDCARFTVANIHGDTISYVSKKTHRESVIPVHKNLQKYLEQDVSRSLIRTHKHLIDTLQNICRKCGITETCKVFVGGRNVSKPKYQLIGFHSLRRTFASIMATKGVPVSVIQQWMGHASIMQTNAYICIDMREQNKKYAELFA